MTDVFGRSIGGVSGGVISQTQLNQLDHKYVNVSGDELTGNLDLKNNKIINLGNPTSSTDAITKSYVDNINLNADRITSGTFNVDRIPGLDASKITTGTLSAQRMPAIDADASIITRGVFDAARIPVITNSKLAQAGSRTLKGNPQGETAAIQDISISNIYNDLTDIELGKNVTARGTSSSGRYRAIVKETGNLMVLNYQNDFSKIRVDSDVDMNNKKIINLATPTANPDAANKSYVDQQVNETKSDVDSLVPSPAQLRYLEFKEIRDDLVPAIWLSGHYLNDFKIMNNPTLGISSNGDAVNLGSDENTTRSTANPPRGNQANPRAIHFDRTNNITSGVNFGTQFTFVLVARTSANNTGFQSRVWTSGTGNRVFGYWNQRTRLASMGGNVIGVNDENMRDDDHTIHVQIFRNNNDVKDYWWVDTNTKGQTFAQRRELNNSTNGENTWGNTSIVFGMPAVFPEDAGECFVFEAFAFNVPLSDTQVEYVYNVLVKYYL